MFPMHTALIFKEQAIVKVPEFREKRLAHTNHSIQHIDGYEVLCYKKYLHFSITEINNKEYCPDTMKMYFIRETQGQKRLSGML
jgi:hypothetical protein